MFILASASPQRREILERVGVDFHVVPSSFDESSVGECDPLKRVQILAQKKAQDVSAAHPDQWIIAADTLMVASDGTLLEKPLNEDDARRMLRLHSGSTSLVHTALCLRRGEQEYCDISTARVTFKQLSEDEIEWWIETGNWAGRSGALQIEGEGSRLVEKLEGEEETVIGFPVQLFQELFLRLQIEIQKDPL